MPIFASKLDLKTEAVLDTAIQFQKDLSSHFKKPKAIFLTGATGFLGVYLLNELLQETKADIYCLIRCQNIQDGKKRLQNHLKFYSLWRDNFMFRIIPIIGDLSQPLFGLLPEKFSELAEKIDIIYHNGAWVNSARPYSTLKATNVLGTQEVLRLASQIHTKPVHFISTMAVFFSETHLSGEKILESDIPNSFGLKGGYKQSKWVAEQLITIAKERGLPANIYRPSRIIGDSKTGINNSHQDSLWMVLKACIELKKFPILEANLNLVTVDYVSQAIIYLSQQENNLDKIFHLTNPCSTTWENIFNSISALGYSLQKVPYNDFLREINEQLSQNPQNKLYSSLVAFLNSPNILFTHKPCFRGDDTLKKLANTSIVCPTFDEKLLVNYFSYFQKIGYFPFP